jgi:hypothetical protein
MQIAMIEKRQLLEVLQWLKTALDSVSHPSTRGDCFEYRWSDRAG